MNSCKKVKNKNMKNSNVKKEVSRILHNNMHRLDLKESSDIPFIKDFLYSLVNEQEQEVETPEGKEPASEEKPKTPDEFTPEQNQKDLESSLDPSTDPSTFDVEGVSPEFTVQHIEKILKWSEKLDEFAMFLNSPKEESLHKILADNDRGGSLLRGVLRKSSDSITRITGEIEKLKAVLDTYINTAPKKLRDTEQIKLAS
jgi:hypothetical protein